MTVLEATRSKMAVNTGVRVLATTRDRDCFAMLEKLGAERCEIGRPDLSKHIPEAKKRCGAQLGGQPPLARLPRRASSRGRSCLPGFLGGLAPVPEFNPLLQMSSGVRFSFFGSFVFTTPGFPLSNVPPQQIAAEARPAGSMSGPPGSSACTSKEV